MRQIFLFIITIVVLTSCANIKSPQGGLKDTKPPQIDSTESFTPNFQTNFQDNFIALPFDEWIVLKDVLNEVVISPPLEKPIDMTLKKRTVIIDFSEEKLRENTTYTINFSKSIKDLNEGNYQKNFRYIFSTGDVIDSLEVSGNVIDALTEKPIEDVLVVLYDDLSDSVVHKERPYYFARTNENGRFTIPFVKQDTFKILALKDENANYKYDLPNEQIAFSDKVIITGDTIVDNPTLRFFTEVPILKVFRPTSPHFGYIPIIFTDDNLENITVEPMTTGLETLMYTEADTLNFWYNNEGLDSLNLIVYNDKTLRDTFTVKLNTKANYSKSNTKVTTVIPRKQIQHNPDETVKIRFNHPISSIDLTKVILLEDSLKTTTQPVITIDSLQPNQLIINYKWKETKPYQLIFPDSSLFDFHQMTNDTIALNYIIFERKQFGHITATAEGLNPEVAYIIQIITIENEVVRTFYSKGKTIATQKFLSLKPTDYKLRVIIDENENQRWDTGDYPTSQPESIVFSNDATTLRQNWELDLKIQLENDIENQ